jgi:acetylornithine/succinyldiaminopimelate/putrescine aminotransferase
MKQIPIKAAKAIAEIYGYDQVIIYARKVGDANSGGEHMTTYGATKEHCSVAGRIGKYLQTEIMGWKS